jgi:hypothetical protein
VHIILEEEEEEEKHLFSSGYWYRYMHEMFITVY